MKWIPPLPISREENNYLVYVVGITGYYSEKLKCWLPGSQRFKYETKVEDNYF